MKLCPHVLQHSDTYCSYHQCFISMSCTLCLITDRLQCLQQGQETRENRKTTPHYRWVFLAGIKTIGAMMLPFGCNTSQPIPNILADNAFSKNGQVKFWPDNEKFRVRLKKSIISLLQLVVNRNERC